MNLAARAKTRKFFREASDSSPKKKREIGFSPSRGGSFERVTDGDVRKCDVLRLCDARDTSLSRNLTLRMTDAYKYRMIMIFVKNCRPPFSLPMVNAS